MSNDNAPAHGIPRPLIVNGCIASPCRLCGDIWTDAYLEDGLCGGCFIDPEVKYQTVTD